MNIARLQFNGGFDRVAGIAHVMMVLKVRFQAFQDFDRIFDRRLVHVNFLEPARKGPVLFEMLAEFFVSG